MIVGQQDLWGAFARGESPPKGGIVIYVMKLFFEWGIVSIERVGVGGPVVTTLPEGKLGLMTEQESKALAEAVRVMETQ